MGSSSSWRGTELPTPCSNGSSYIYWTGEHESVLANSAV